MGYDASVFLIYGVYFKYNKTNVGKIQEILRAAFPDANDEIEDMEFDNDSLYNGYHILNFIDHDTKTSRLFITCWFHEHISARGAHDMLEVKLPRRKVKKQFKTWCKENNIDKTPKLYTQLYESY